jgi:hypothetical protein
MILFFIKKAFFSGWDNLFHILVLNILVVALAIGGYCGAAVTVNVLPLSIAILVVAAAAEGIILVALSSSMARVAAYKAFTFRDFFAELKVCWKHGILYALTAAAFVFIMAVALPYYFKLGNVVGLGLAMLMFWFGVIFVLAFQWFLPIRSQLNGGFLKSLRKCFIIFFDNPGFSLFMFFYSIILLVLSVVMIFLLPGFSGLVLAQNEAFRLRLYKYDWMEQHPELDFRKARKSIPWGELIAEDYETVGHRSLKSFIFPWKD